VCNLPVSKKSPVHVDWAMKGSLNPVGYERTRGDNG
jgi:hypothetical protein